MGEPKQPADFLDLARKPKIPWTYTVSQPSVDLVCISRGEAQAQQLHPLSKFS
jgi:hypothetical protein